MAFISLWLSYVLVPVILSLGYVIYQRLLSPVAKFPGPFVASITPLWKVCALTKRTYHETVLALHKQYGKIVRIGPNELLLSDPAAVREIYVSPEFLKTDFYDAFTPFRPTIFSQRDPQLHAQRKRIVSQGYSMSSIQSMEKFVQERLLVFLRKMQLFAHTGEIVEIDKWIHFFSFDVIGELAFSEGFGMLESGVEEEHITLINQHFEFSTIFGNLPWVLSLTKSSLFPFSWVKNLQKRRERLKELSRSRLATRLEKSSDRNDLFGRLLRAKDPMTGNKLDNVDLSTEAFSAIVAGSDSTSTALAFTLYHILNHPTVYKTLTEEIRTRFGTSEELSLAGMPKYAELAGLKYLQACIKESLRLTSPTTISLPRYVPRGGRMIAGHYFPPGVAVGAAAQAIHLNTDNYGPDAFEYNPGRWLKEQNMQDPEELQKFWVPFGIGNRSCIGKNVALMELTTLIGTTLLWFDLEFSPSVGPQRELPETSSMFNQKLKDPLKVNVRVWS